MGVVAGFALGSSTAVVASHLILTQSSGFSNQGLVDCFSYEEEWLRRKKANRVIFCTNGDLIWRPATVAHPPCFFYFGCLSFKEFLVRFLMAGIYNLLLINQPCSCTSVLRWNVWRQHHHDWSYNRNFSFENKIVFMWVQNPKDKKYVDKLCNVQFIHVV